MAIEEATLKNAWDTLNLEFQAGNGKACVSCWLLRGIPKMPRIFCEAGLEILISSQLARIPYGNVE